MFKGAAKSSGKSPRKKARKSLKTKDVTDDVSTSLLFSKCDKPSTEIRLDSYQKIWHATKKKSEVILELLHIQNFKVNVSGVHCLGNYIG